MAFDDREEIDGTTQPEVRAARQLRLPDLLRGPFDNPVVILIALTFWGWMWGISGVILAVPILATFKIFCDHIEPMTPIGEFLS